MNKYEIGNRDAGMNGNGIKIDEKKARTFANMMGKVCENGFWKAQTRRDIMGVDEPEYLRNWEWYIKWGNEIERNK